MGQRDIAAGKIFHDKKRFADLYNSIVFQGHQIIRPEELEVIRSESDIFVQSKEKSVKGIRRYRDVVMRWKEIIDLAILACEVQDSIHYAMPVRTILYDGLGYTEQMERLWKVHQTNGVKPTNEEFLSSFYKGDKLIPILTIVFYYGNKKWDGPINLYDMFDIPNDELGNILKEYVPNYWINLFDVQNSDISYQFRSDLQILVDMIRYRRDKSKLLRCIDENKDYFSNLDTDTYQAIQVFLNFTKEMKSKIKAADGKGRYNMCEALLEYYQDGVNEGTEQSMNAVIKTIHKYVPSKEKAVFEVIECLGVDKAAAQKHVDAYWD